MLTEKQEAEIRRHEYTTYQMHAVYHFRYLEGSLCGICDKKNQEYRELMYPGEFPVLTEIEGE